jgi:trans-aconitate 2-methyltransferase
VLAVDLSCDMLSVAAAKLRPGPAARAFFAQASLLALPVAAWADAIFSTATFHWILDHRQLFAELFAALRPGGRLVAQCGGGPNLERFLARATSIAGAPPFGRWFEGWTRPWELADAATTKQRLEAAGFVNVSASLEDAPTPFDCEGRFAEFLTTVVLRPHLARLPHESLRGAFVAEVVRACAGSPDGLLLDYVRLNMDGTKPEHARTPFRLQRRRL